MTALFLLASFAACTDENGAVSSEAEAISSEAIAESSESETSTPDSESSEADVESSTPADESSENSESSKAESEEPKTEAFDASLLVGTWKRIATEVEGDANDGGNCTITVTGTSKDDLMISYFDKDFPETKFSEKPITIVESDLPEESWHAVVDYVGAYDTKYDFEIAEDGTLLFYNNFEIDGAPMVSVEIFEKAE